MKVLNIHSRNIKASKSSLAQLFSNLATKEDKIWPHKTWPPMRFKEGLNLNSEGGHGPIKYKIVDFNPEEGFIKFQFQEPKGFNGFHFLELKSIQPDLTEIKHTIEMETSFVGTMQWVSFVKWLHDALIEDAFDNLEEMYSKDVKKKQWTSWVKFLRLVLK